MREAIQQFMTYLGRACDHYEKSAPTVRDYLDDLYTRIGSAPETVNLMEITVACGLEEADGWEQPNYAANRIYHLAERLGKATTGHAGF